MSQTKKYKTIEITKMMQAYAASSSEELRSILDLCIGHAPEPNQTDTIRVSDETYSIVMGIINDEKHDITENVKVISRKRMLDITRNVQKLTEKINNFPCITTGNVMLNIIWKYVTDIDAALRKWGVEFKNYTVFRNTNNDLMYYINSDIINLIREFECITSIPVGFFEDSFRKYPVSVVRKYATCVGLIQQLMYTNKHERASNIGRINAALLFAPRSNDNQHIYLNKFFNHELKREYNECHKYLDSLDIEYGDKNIDIEDKEKYPCDAFISNLSIHTLQRPDILFDEYGEITNFGVNEMRGIEEFFFDEKYGRVIEMLSTYALPYDANCIQSVLATFKTLVDEAESLEDMAVTFSKKIEDTPFAKHPEYRFLKETIYSDAENLLALWQFTQDYIFAVYVAYLYSTKDDSIEQLSIEFNIKNLLADNIDNCDDETKRNKYNPYGAIEVEEDEKPDDDWCDDDCHLCSARKRCHCHNKDNKVNIEHIVSERLKDGVLNVYRAKAGKDTNIIDVIEAFIKEINK